MTTTTQEKRVIITQGMVGICHMQVCAVEDATDDEILEVCNRENQPGTTNGWSRVIREPDENRSESHHSAPIPCEDMAGRLHFLVVC